MVKYKLEKDDFGDVPSYKGLNNTCIKSDWDETAQATNTSKRRERLKSCNGTRRFGQQLYPMFFRDSRATTANTNVIKKRQQSRFSVPSLSNQKLKSQNINLSEIAIKSQQYAFTSFKENIGKFNFYLNLDNLHRKTLTSKYVDTSRGAVVKGNYTLFQKS